jgi:hypothetical protein
MIKILLTEQSRILKVPLTFLLQILLNGRDRIKFSDVHNYLITIFFVIISEFVLMLIR